MKKKQLIILVIAILVIGFLVYINEHSKNDEDNVKTPASQNTTTPELFSNSPLFPYAHLISTPTFDTDTQKALTGFTVTKNTLADGSTQITLNSQNAEYHSQTYVVKEGEKLYFIEKSYGDDSNNQERFLRDDTAILVGANGYIK
ncbi:MAG: hypothetical protein KGI58_01705 [Patescibacteria group bacterium]|nr:hypothetical protein [Patescibacteria group bacterium]